MKEPLIGHLSAPAKLIFLFLLIICCYVVISIAGIVLAIPIFHINLFTNFSDLLDVNKPGSIPLLKYLQIFQSISLFVVPALLAGFFFGGNSTKYLKLDNLSTGRIYLAVIMIMFVSLPMVSWMTSLNEMMKLPGFMKGIESWMKETEDTAAQLTEAFLKVNSAGGLALNMLMIAIIPAIGEELFFRGMLQRLLREWFKNAHIAILVTSVFFAAIHLQFYGFLPRMMLGMLFGYLLEWTGSIWVPICAHFLNNGSAVVISFLISRGTIASQYEDFGNTSNLFLIAGSVFFTAGLLYLVYRTMRKKEFN